MPKKSGPRLASGAYYSKGKKRGRPRKNKVGYVSRKSQVSTIKRVVKSMSESKYFHTNPALDQTPSASAWKTAAAESEVAVYGYTTGLNRARIDNGATVTQTIYKYGVRTVDGSVEEVPILSLDLNKVFTKTNGTPQRANMAVDGTTIRPNYNEVRWLLDRVQGNVTGNSDNGLVYKVRMIRVMPKPRKGTYIQIDPKTDLFLDQYNEHFGIQTDKDGVQSFNRFTCMLAKVNNRRYTVIADKMFTIKPSNLAIIDTAITVPEVNDGTRMLKTHHKIGKKFFYENPENKEENEFGQYPTTGFRNEFILFHVIALGNPNVAANDRVTPGLLNITARPVSTFKDM